MPGQRRTRLARVEPAVPAHAQVAQLDRADGRAHQAQHRVAERVEHAAHDAAAPSLQKVADHGRCGRMLFEAALDPQPP
jgi:hypothetical protein